jgi:hypothetical protein
MPQRFLQVYFTQHCIWNLAKTISYKLKEELKLKALWYASWVHRLFSFGLYHWAKQSHCKIVTNLSESSEARTHSGNKLIWHGFITNRQAVRNYKS